MALPDSSSAFSASSTEKAALRQREIDTQLAGLHSHLSGVRAAAAKRLGDLQAGIDELLETLHDPSDYVRGAAAVALSSFSANPRAPEIIDALLTAIDDPSEKVCQAAIRSLGIMHAKAARAEIEAFLEDPNPYIIGTAILALARMGADDLAETFVELLNHASTYVKMQAVRAVGILKYAPAGPQIEKLLQSTRRERMASGQADLAARLERREDDLYSLQNHLIRTAGELRLKTAVPLLVEIAQKDIGLRGLAVEALIEIGADVAPELLTGLLSDPSAYLRRRIILLMTQHNYRPALPLLRPLLREESASIRSVALQAVTQMSDQDALPQIRWMSAHDSNPFIRVQALQSLAALSGPEAAPYLVTLAEDSNYQVRREAVSHLLEWEAFNPQALTVIARFARDFPEDALHPAITVILERNSFVQGQDLSRSIRQAPVLIPSELVADIPDLLNRLEHWQQGLRRGEAEAMTPEWQNIDEALACLIDVLKRSSE